MKMNENRKASGLYKVNIIIVLAIVLLSMNIYADGRKITITVTGNNDSTLLLASYYGEKIKLVDTAFSVKKDGNFVFESDEKLPGGIYMAVTPDKKKLFEFIISDDQNFKIITDTADYIRNMT